VYYDGFMRLPALLALLVLSHLRAAEPSPALSALIADADRALKTEPLSVMDKKLTPPSGDKHDYMSVGPYWWPDPAKVDGLPYIRRDGEQNPTRNSADTDRASLGRLLSSVQTLALAYRETGREPYAEHAAKLVRVWFLDPPTRMNPHLEFGQAIPGRVTGRGIGIIDTAGLADLTKAVGWIERSKTWTVADRTAMQAWLARYLDWLLTSSHGRDEAKAENNHGTWYDVQVASFALYAGKTDLAQRVLEEAKQKRIATQIEPDGKQPRELARTKSFSYSAMNLRAFFDLASLGERVNVDLWNFQTPDGRSIRKALDYLAPYADPAKEWPDPQIDGGVSLNYRLELAALLRRAAIAWKEPRYEELLRKLPAARVETNRLQLLWR
jgi:hypothetical protein